MKTLYLLRHAKSDRSGSLEDKERPLNRRGREAAPRIGAAMAARGLSPELVLVSTSKRTRETWDLLAPELPRKPLIEHRDDLYLAPAARLLHIVAKIDPSVGRALILGHNPGLEDLASRLAASKQPDDGRQALERLKTKFPTCGLAVLSFAVGSWGDVKPGTGELIAFLTPATG